MPYRIKNYTKKQAKKYGLTVKPSKLRGKKIDVFKKDKKVSRSASKKVEVEEETKENTEE